MTVFTRELHFQRMGRPRSLMSRQNSNTRSLFTVKVSSKKFTSRMPKSRYMHSISSTMCPALICLSVWPNMDLLQNTQWKGQPREERKATFGK